MEEQVPARIARERNQILRNLAAEKKLAFMRSFIGQEVEAITLNVISENSHGIWTEALTDNYLKSRIRGKHAPNTWLSAKVEMVEDGQLVAVARGKLSSCA
jgi:tRNA A37 methylthiotransferase MiaB